MQSRDEMTVHKALKVDMQSIEKYNLPMRL
jgi:hypothetical protein